jgi:hypothetical protein
MGRFLTVPPGSDVARARVRGAEFAAEQADVLALVQVLNVGRHAAANSREPQAADAFCDGLADQLVARLTADGVTTPPVARALVGVLERHIAATVRRGESFAVVVPEVVEAAIDPPVMADRLAVAR